MNACRCVDACAQRIFVIGGLMVSVLDSGASGPAWTTSFRVRALARDFALLFLGKTLNFHGGSLHPGV